MAQGYYCPMCDTMYGANGKCKCVPDTFGKASVGILSREPIDSVDVESYLKGWNEAIETAAKIADDADEIAARDIRRLKK